MVTLKVTHKRAFSLVTNLGNQNLLLTNLLTIPQWQLIKSIMPAYRSALLFGLVFTFCQCLVIAGLVAVVVFNLSASWFPWLRCHHFDDNCFCCFGCVGNVPKITPFYGLKELLPSFYGLAKFRYMLTICAMRSPVVLVVCFAYPMA